MLFAAYEDAFEMWDAGGLLCHHRARSCFMASNLIISEHGGCAILQIAAFQERILTILFLDGEHSLLPFLFS